MKTTRKMIENQVKWLQAHIPQKLEINSVNYYNPSRRYCLMTADGRELTRWLLASEFCEAVRAMENIAILMQSNFDMSCAGCGDRIRAEVTE